MKNRLLDYLTALCSTKEIAADRASDYNLVIHSTCSATTDISSIHHASDTFNAVQQQRRQNSQTCERKGSDSQWDVQ